MRLALLGLGLIGGSIARALREADAADGWRVAAWSPSGRGPAAAVADGTIERAAASLADAVAGADLVVLAAPPLACLDLLDALAALPPGTLTPDAVVTDVASTKGAILERAAARGLRFVGGHPMAGREVTGYEAADGSLFVERPWVIVPSGDQRADARVAALALGCRARPLFLDATTHDRAVAAISHLPLVAAAALVRSVAGPGGEADGVWPTAARLAASGWRDTTRLARGDVAMGAGIAVTNAPALAARLRAFRDELDAWLAELERDGGPDPDRLASLFDDARRRLETDTST